MEVNNMTRLLKKIASDKFINKLENVTTLEQDVLSSVDEIANFVLEDNSFDGDELDLLQEVEQYFKEDIYWLIEHIDIPDELVDEANSLDNLQIKELNEDLINKFDLSISNLLEGKLLNV